MNTFGNIYRLTSFGESHGPGIGGVIDGCPAGIELDTAFIQQELNRRKPGQSRITTPRKEDDEVQFLSGIYEGKTTGTPIGFIIWNKNQHSSDYDNMKTVYRPSHADYTYQTKYGIRDPRGGGRSSARETIARCVAGAIAKLALKQYGIQIQAYTSQVGPIKLAGSYQDYDLSLTEKSDVRCPDPKTASEMETLIAEVKSKGDTIGGVITCVAKGVPVGLGEPVFGKLHAALGHAMLTINAVKGFEYGDGFNAAFFRGSERNDRFFNDNGHINTRTNNSGGIQGGISNGQDIYFRVAFKSVATILMEQETVNMEGEDTILKARGRHDPCVLPRAVPIVESMTAMTLLDYLLIQKDTGKLLRLILYGLDSVNYSRIIRDRLALGFKLASMHSKYFIWFIGLSILSMGLSGYFLYLAQKSIPIGTAYVIWTGIGAIGTVLLGILFFHDSANIFRLLFLSLILIGIVGLKLVH